MGDNNANDGFDRFEKIFLETFPPADYPVLVGLWNENKFSDESVLTLSAKTEDFLQHTADQATLQAAQKELQELWSDENFKQRLNKYFVDNDPELEPLFVEYRKALLETLSNARKEKAQVLKQLVDEKLKKPNSQPNSQPESQPESQPDSQPNGQKDPETKETKEVSWYDKEWQGLAIKYWIAIGVGVLLLIILIVVASGKKSYDPYSRQQIMMPPPPLPQYGYGY